MNVKIWVQDFSRPKYLTFTASVDDRGRIHIPSEIRKKLRLTFSSRVQTMLKPYKEEATY